MRPQDAVPGTPSGAAVLPTLPAEVPKIDAGIASCVPAENGQATGIPKHPTLTDQIRRAILDAPISRYELAKRLGISQGTLGDFVSGRTGIGSKLLDRVAVELGLRLVVGRPRRARK